MLTTLAPSAEPTTAWRYLRWRLTLSIAAVVLAARFYRLSGSRLDASAIVAAIAGLPTFHFLAWWFGRRGFGRTSALALAAGAAMAVAFGAAVLAIVLFRPR